MEIRVMGGVEISRDGAIERVPGRTQRSLLGLLTARPAAWSASRLIETLWPQDSSGQAVTRLHVQVHRLRRRLGADVVESSPDGYRLAVSADVVDVWRFEQAAELALQVAATDGAGSRALARMDAVVAQWGGEPFPAVDLPVVVEVRHRLEELFLRLQERRCQMLLDRGDSQRALDLVSPLAQEHPTRERLRNIHITALHRTGRRDSIPGVLDAACRQLVDLGLEPGPDLLDVRAHVVDADPYGQLRQALAANGAGEHERPPWLVPDREDQIRRSLMEDRVHPSGPSRDLAYVLAAKGRQEEALSMLGHLEAQHRAAGGEDARAMAIRDMAGVISLSGDLRRALRLLGEAGRLEERTVGTDALLLTVRALILTHLIRLKRARGCLVAAGEPRTARDRANGRAVLWWRAASQIDRRSGNHEAAVAGAREAYRLVTAQPSGADPGPVLVELACSLRDAGEPECFGWFRQVADVAHQSGRGPLAACAHAAAAKAALQWADPQAARAHATAGLEMARRFGCWIFAARAAARLGTAEAILGRPDLAEWYHFEALSFYRRVDFPLDHASRAALEGCHGAPSTEGIE